MSEKLEYTVTDGVSVISMAHGPGGAPAVMDVAARLALLSALDRAESDTAVIAVVITGQGSGFPGGLPVDEIAVGEAQPTLAAVCQRLEDFPKPVVAALRGGVFDGGLALALAAHARLAAAGTRLGLNDIRRGLVPGAGATQRLPRLVGAGPALDMIFQGRVLGAESGQLRGLFRRVVPRNVVGEAVGAAREMALGGGAEPAEELPPGLADPASFQAAIATRRTGATLLPPEAEAALNCVEAAQLLPLEAGVDMEEDLRAELRGSIRAKGLIRATALEARGPLAEAGPQKLTLLGDGPLAVVLARRALAAGLSVALAEQREGGAQDLIRRVAARDEQRERLTGGAAEDVLADAEFVVETCDAPAEAMPGLAELAARATGGGVPVLLTSNMTLGAGKLHGILNAQTAGLAVSDHPGVSGKGLAEIAVGERIGEDVARQARALLRRLGYAVLVCPARNGLVAGRLKAAMLAAVEWCVAQGAEPDVIEAAMGWPVGPFRQADAEGLDSQRVRFAALGWGAQHGGLFDAFAQAGLTGRAAGRGVFPYDENGVAGDYDGPARDVVARWRLGALDGRAFSAAELRRRVWSALFSAGMRLLEDGGARDAGDIDLAALEALGLPRASGGPMKTAELRGLLTVRRELVAWHSDAPALWAGSPRLDEMVKNGEGFGYEGSGVSVS